jgi:hypothetical protein
VGEAIGGEMGEFLEMDKGEDGSAVGRFLRIKIRLDIRKPLMRGVSVHVEKEGELQPLWCPVMYEYLPDFCFTCGIIGHIDRVCEKKLEKGEIQQFSKSLRFIPEKRRTEEGRGDKTFWRASGSGSRGSWSSGGRGGLLGLGSDAPSWRKADGKGGKKVLGAREEEEVTSPIMKIGKEEVQGGLAKKQLLLDKEVDPKEQAGGGEAPPPLIDLNRNMQGMHVDQTVGASGEALKDHETKEVARKKMTYRKITRGEGAKASAKEDQELSKKRSLPYEFLEEKEGVMGGKKTREVISSKRLKKAGLADQSCGTQ